MRTFIAIEIPEEIKKTLAAIESHLKYSQADVKWVKPEIIHLTLKFLGEIDEKKCEEVKALLDTVGKNNKLFEISLKDIGAFPSIDRPRVVWVGLDSGAKESAKIAGEVEESFARIGFAKEIREFAAHLTIGRVRSSKNIASLKDKVLSYKFPTIEPQLVSSITLFKSTLTPEGPIYTKLHEAKLG